MFVGRARAGALRLRRGAGAPQPRSNSELHGGRHFTPSTVRRTTQEWRQAAQEARCPRLWLRPAARPPPARRWCRPRRAPLPRPAPACWPTAPCHKHAQPQRACFVHPARSSTSSVAVHRARPAAGAARAAGRAGARRTLAAALAARAATQQPRGCTWTAGQLVEALLVAARARAVPVRPAGAAAGRGQPGRQRHGRRRLRCEAAAWRAGCRGRGREMLIGLRHCAAGGGAPFALGTAGVSVWSALHSRRSVFAGRAAAPPPPRAPPLNARPRRARDAPL